MQLREIYDKYGSMGLELAEQIGAENVAMVMRFQTPGMAPRRFRLILDRIEFKISAKIFLKIVSF